MSPSRVGSYAGWVTLAGVLAFEVFGPLTAAGQRVTGTSDAATIAGYYRNSGLLPLALGAFLIMPPFVALIVSLRRSLVEQGANAIVAEVGFAIALVAVPLLVAKTALQMALVRVVETGADPVALFVSWDYLYNSGVYVIEGSYIAAFSLAMRGTVGYPGWLSGLGFVTAALQLVNMTALVVELPDAATLPGNISFAIWLGGIAVVLGRMSRPAPGPVRAPVRA